MRRPAITSKRKARIVGAVVLTGALVTGVAGVNALSANGSREYSQDAPGVAGSTKVGDFFAASVAVGDFDNDGNGDVIAGAPFENASGKRDAGIVHVLYGRNSGLSTSNDITLSEDSSKVKGKAEANDLFGSAVATGDFDNDGYDDAVVGVPGEDVAGHVDAGGITVLYGSGKGLRGRGSASFNQASQGIAGDPEQYGYFGASLAVGDFNRDGADDVAVGVPGSNGSGLVHVLYGSGNGLRPAGDLRLHRGLADVPGDATAGDEFGASLAAGDFDGDGDDDLAVGIPGLTLAGHPAAGGVQVFDGSKSGIKPATGKLFSQATSKVGDAPEMDDLFGASLAAGDYDGNGRDDLAVGAPGEGVKAKRAAGKVHVLYGTRNGLSGKGSGMFSQNTPKVKSKAEAGDEFGLALAAGDFNGNGRDDLAIGAPGEGMDGLSGAGVVHVLFGTSNGLNANKHQWYWPGHKDIPGQSRSNAGFSRALATGDIDDDGRDDLLSGAPGQKVSGDAAAGTLTLIFG